MPEIEYVYSAHSVYAWLGARRLAEIARAAGARVIHRPVDLTPVVEAVATPFRARSAAHRAYFFGREIERWAEWRGLDWLGRVPETHGADYRGANRRIIAAQRLGLDADALSLAFLDAHWREGADLSDPERLSAIAQGAGLDPETLARAAEDPAVEAEHRANTENAVARSMFGSPTYVVDGDMFYGQDRLEMVARALERPFARR